MTVLGVALALFAGCKPSPPDPTPVPSATATATAPVSATTTPSPQVSPQTSATPDVQGRIELMMSTWDGNSFSLTELERLENGPIFLKIIEQTDNPRMKASAFYSLRTTYGSVLADATRNFGGSPSFVKVVLDHLESSDPVVQDGALRAAKHAMGDDPVPEVQAALARLLEHSNDARVRFLAQEALDNTETRPPEYVTEARLGALDDPKPYVVALVLHDLDVTTVRDQRALQARLLELMKHKTPAVRGEAVKRLADMPRTPVKAAQVAEKVKPLLKDKHPYPRGQAVIALADLIGVEAIPEIVELLSDSKESRYRLEFKDAAGKTDSVEDWTYSWGRVDEAVVRTIAALTYGKPYSFDLGVIFYESRFEDIEREAERAKDWYEKNRAMLLNSSSADPE